MSQVIAHCWRKIGVYGGDHSCERIAEFHHCRNCAVFQEAARSAFAVEAEPDEEAQDFTVDRDAQVSLLVFRLGENWLGLPTDSLAELAPSVPVRRIAHRTRGAFEGLANVRGELQLCVSLLERFGLGSRERQQALPTARLVLMRNPQGALLAFRADQVLGLRRAPRGSLEVAPQTLPTQLADAVLGVQLVDGLRVLLLDGEAVYACLAAGLYA